MPRLSPVGSVISSAPQILAELVKLLRIDLAAHPLSPRAARHQSPGLHTLVGCPAEPALPVGLRPENAISGAEE